jgi:hypothetical protein
MLVALKKRLAPTDFARKQEHILSLVGVAVSRGLRSRLLCLKLHLGVNTLTPWCRLLVLCQGRNTNRPGESLTSTLETQRGSLQKNWRTERPSRKLDYQLAGPYKILEKVGNSYKETY